MCVLTVSMDTVSSAAISSLEAGPSAGRQSALSTRSCAGVSTGTAPADATSVSLLSCPASDGSWKRSRVAPTRITSRWRNGRRPATRSSLTNVPLVERPSSSTVQTPSRHSIDVCERETCASQGSAIPAVGDRPTVSWPVSVTIRCTPSPSRSSRNGASARSAARRACSSAGDEA